MSEIIFTNRRRDAAVNEAIRMAKVEATRHAEGCCVAICLECGPRDRQGSCFMCERIEVDPVGRVTREAIQ